MSAAEAVDFRSADEAAQGLEEKAALAADEHDSGSQAVVAGLHGGHHSSGDEGIAEGAAATAEGAAKSHVVEGCQGDARANSTSVDAAAVDINADLLSLPPDGAEVFIGGVPHGASDEELRAFCEAVGSLHRIHVPVKDRRDGSCNPGYAFATYMTKAAAARAIEELSGQTLPKFPSLPVRVAYSDKRPKNKLYLGNLPRHLDHATLLAQLKNAVPGVVEVDILPSKLPGAQATANRGFGFVELYNHACAEHARTILSAPGFHFGGIAVSPALEVQWADSKGAEADAAAVKSVYVSNLPTSMTEAKLRELFEPLAPIERVALLPHRDDPTRTRDYAFVHYAKRSTALQVLTDCQKAPLVSDGSTLTVAMAKPTGVRPEQDRGREHGQDYRSGGPLLGPHSMGGSVLPPRHPHAGYSGYDDYNSSYPGRGPSRNYYSPSHGHWNDGMDHGPPRRSHRDNYEHADYDDYGYGSNRGPASGVYQDSYPRGSRSVPMMMPAGHPESMMLPLPTAAGMGPFSGGPAPRFGGPATGGYGSARPATGGYGVGGRETSGGSSAGVRASAQTSTASKGYGQHRYSPYSR